MFHWSHYLALAEELAERPQDEAAWRSAVSRAYYSVYDSARRKLTLPDVSAEGGHLRVWREFASRTGVADSYMGAAGERLRKLRNRADYEMNARISQKDARTAVELARTIAQLLQA